MSEPSGSSRTFQIDGKYPSWEGDQEHSATGTVRLMRTDMGIWASAALDSEIVCTCSRCLRPYSQSIHVVIEEEALFPGDAPRDGSDDPSDPNRESLLISYEKTLDITEAVRQYTELGVPLKPVCMESCAGICLECGADLNEASCDCRRDTGDRRWDALLTLSSYGRTGEAPREL